MATGLVLVVVAAACTPVAPPPDSRWDDDDLNQLKDVPGTAFEVVYTGDPVTG